MQDCFLLNNQQHTGLQKLSVLSGTSHSSLGPIKKHKFIQDDTSGESTLVCSSFSIIESLELTCGVGQLVCETLQSHQKLYHTGCGCLLFLAGAWSRAALECLQKGMSVPHIISAMSEGINICMDVCRRCAIPVENIRYSVTPQGQPITEVLSHSHTTRHFVGKTLNISERRKLKLSRHFFENDSSQVGETHQPKLNVPYIAKGLRHGCIDKMKLVMEAFQILSETSQADTSSFDVSRVVTCVLPGLPEHHSCVVRGCVVLLADEQTLVAHRLEDQHLKVALITGDLTHSYRHLGFTSPKGLQRIRDGVAVMSKKEQWMESVVDLLMKLEVNLILISGRACEEMIQHCCRRHILVVDKVKSSVLKIFANSIGAIPVTYPTQLGKDCIGTGVKVMLWRDLSSPERKSAAAVNICSSGSSRLVTVVLTGCVHAKLPVLEDQFWACVYRLHHALKDGSLLLGAGRTELLCVHHLLKPVKHDDSVPYMSLVLHLMADGLIDYISTVFANTGRFSKVKARTLMSEQVKKYSEHPDTTERFSQLLLEAEMEDWASSPEGQPEEVYDNLSVKQEAWRKALDLVFLVLQTDAEIITGAQETNTENLMQL